MARGVVPGGYDGSLPKVEMPRRNEACVLFWFEASSPFNKIYPLGKQRRWKKAFQLINFVIMSSKISCRQTVSTAVSFCTIIARWFFTEPAGTFFLTYKHGGDPSVGLRAARVGMPDFARQVVALRQASFHEFLLNREHNNRQ